MWWWWRYACHQCIQPHYFQPDLMAIRTYFTRWLIQRYFQMSQKDVIKWTSFIRLASFKPIFFTTDLLICETPLWRICAQDKWSEWVWERCTLSLKSAYRTYNVLCISDVLKCIFPILLIIFQWGKTLNIFLFPFALRLFFLPNGGQFYLFYVKCTLKRKSPRKQD